MSIGSDVIGKIHKLIQPKTKYEKWWEKRGEKLYNKLSQKKVTDVDFNGQFITVEFNGKKLTNEVYRQEHEKWVGSWDRERPIVYYDNDLDRLAVEKNIPPAILAISISTHETIEKYLSEELGFDADTHAHYLAEHIEKEDFVPKFGQKMWDIYSEIVETVHRQELKHLEGKVYHNVIH